MDHEGLLFTIQLWSNLNVVCSRTYFLVLGSVSITLPFSKKFDADVGPNLTDLASELMHKYPQKAARYVCLLFLL